jgi:hypothetical protein
VQPGVEAHLRREHDVLPHVDGAVAVTRGRGVGVLDGDPEDLVLSVQPPDKVDVGLVEGDAEATHGYAAQGREGHLERLLRVIQAHTTLASPKSRIRDQLEYVGTHYRQRLLLVVVADEHELAEADVNLVRRLHAQHEILWVTVEDADPTAAGHGNSTVDVGEDVVLAPEVRFDARLHDAYATAVEARRKALESTLEGLGIVHVRVGSTDKVLGTMFRMLERQRRRGR